MKAIDIIAELHVASDESHRVGMAYFGIKTERALGVSVNTLRQMARRIGKRNTILNQAAIATAQAIEAAEQSRELGGLGCLA